MARSYEALRNRPTSYEVVIVANGAIVRVLGFTAKHTRGALLEFARANGAEILALMTDEQADMEWSYNASRGAVSFGGGAVLVAFTQRTEMDIAKAA